MRVFISLLFVLIFTTSFNKAEANFFSNYSFSFSSEESNKKITLKESNSIKDIKPKSTEPTKQKTAKEIEKEIKKEQRKIAKQSRKEIRKVLWKSIKEQRAVNKENRKKGIKNPNEKVHWAAYLSFFSTLTSIGIITTAIIFNAATYAIFSFLVPFAIGLLVLSVIASIIGISVVASNETTLYHKSHTITLALIGGIIAFLALLFIGFVVLAVSALSY